MVNQRLQGAKEVLIFFYLLFVSFIDDFTINWYLKSQTSRSTIETKGLSIKCDVDILIGRNNFGLW